MEENSKKQGCAPIGKGEFALFRNHLQENSGIAIPPEKAYLFETRLSGLMAEAGIDSFGEFYLYLLSGSDPGIAQKIIDAMTNGETFWFRDAFPWQVMEEKLLPGLVGDLLSGRRQKIRIWCAAASTGQEIYSTVMCVDDYLTRNWGRGVSLSAFEFVATDISSRALEIAQRGRYDALSMTRGLSGYYRAKYFTEADGGMWELDPKIRGAVRFVHFNLQNSYRDFGVFDIIFCRYVLIYFSNALKKEILARMRGALRAEGILFTGNYALYDLLAEDFAILHHEKCSYYRKKD